MRGRQILMESLIAHGISHIFGNPGTTESPLLDSLNDYPDITYIMTLHEGVAVGAASHYAQASGKPALANLHVAPGLGNAIGMMYNALRAQSPIVVTAGQQDTRLRLNEPVLGHDLVAMAAPVVKWSVEAASADELPHILKRAVKIATTAPAGPVFVALPINVMEQETSAPAAKPDPLFRLSPPAADGIAELAAHMASASAPAIIAGDQVASSGAGAELIALAEALGAEVWHELLHMQLSFPTNHPASRGPLGADASGIRKALGDADFVLMVGDGFFEDVWFAPGDHFPAGATVAQIADCSEMLGRKHNLDIGLVGALPASLAALHIALTEGMTATQRQQAAARLKALGLAKQNADEAQRARAERSWDRRPTSMARVMAEIQAAKSDDTIIVDETVTASLDAARTLQIQKSGDYFGARGGGIGQGVAGALGVQVAHPDRQVLAISGDGSAMYSIQALWTAAHHQLAITFVILANREYRVLKHNLDSYRQRFDAASNHAYIHMDLSQPHLDFVAMAKGMGLAAQRIEDPDNLGAALREALNSDRPHLLEVVIEGKA